LIRQISARVNFLRASGHSVLARAGATQPMERVVRLIFWYVGFMIVGDFLAYLLGLFTEREWGSQASLIVFLVLYFLFLWISWVLAVWVTRPKELLMLHPQR
jgi:hypothetical protein